MAGGLVVLSACRTVVGRQIPGEGPLGLARGFLAAGAGSVVATLWQVDDRAGAQLMKSFYRELLHRGQAPAAALRKAQQEIRQQPRFAHPYYWAGYNLFGAGARTLSRETP